MELENRRLLYEPSTSAKGNLLHKFTISEINKNKSITSEPFYAQQPIEQNNTTPSAKIIMNKVTNVNIFMFFWIKCG